MKVFKYEMPKTLEDADGNDIDNPFEGEIEIEIPTYKERLNLVKDSGFDTEKPGIEDGLKMLELVEKRVRSVNCCIEDQPVTSLDDIGYYQVGSLVINAIGRYIMGGFVPNP